MKKSSLFLFLLLVISASNHAFSQERNVIVNTNSVGRTVITSDPNSNGNVDIWKQLEQERIDAEKAEQERIEAAKKAEQERLAAQKAEQERLAAEQAARLAAQKAEKERLAAEQAARLAEQKAEQERLAAEQAARLAAEKAERERIKAEMAEKQRIADSISTAKRLEAEAIKKAHQDSLKVARKERIAAYPWSNFIMLNGAYAVSPEYAFGITYARVKQCGFYLNAMMNPSFQFSADYHATADGAINGVRPFYSGEHFSTRLSATIGGLVRLRAPLYLYAGVGYGYRGLFYETTDQEWVAWHTSNAIYHGMHWEAGMMGNIKGFAISLGISSITDFSAIFYEGKLGLGYCF